MPVSPTYPGVYIEEIPSGVRTIVGVATSITAFVGWAPRGPVDRAEQVLSWQDYERTYGGLDARSLLGYAVYHFFNNGGQQAYIVRLASGAATATVTIDNILKFSAASPGKWAEDYGIVVKARSDDATRFRVAVVQVKPGATPGASVETEVEAFENLSIAEHDHRYVVRVINARSTLITAEVIGTPTTAPSNTGTPSPKLGSGDAGNDGSVLKPGDGTFETVLLASTSGVKLLERVDLFNLLCVPGETEATTITELQKFARDHRAFLIADCAADATQSSLKSGPGAITGDNAINAAFYFPWLKAPDPLQQNRLREFPPCGFVAGLYAKTDAQRGVWKAPAGTEASLSGVSSPTQLLTDNENGTLNTQAINCIRTFNVYGTVIWGARTLHGHDERGSEWKYIPVRRMALFLEETLYRNLKWVVFEPNDEPLWAQIRLNVGAFMHNLFRQGAFQGQTPREAYLVKCDRETTTQNDINLGIVNIVVGFAPLKPAEFVIVKIQQLAGQIAV